MPIRWERHPDKAPATAGAFSHREGAPPAARAVLSPHQSMSALGFVWVIGLTFALFLIPLISVLGSPALWGLLPFVLGALWLLWYFLRRNQRDAALTEELTLWTDRIEIRRVEPRGQVREWTADPYWVRIDLHRSGGPVPDYLTLSGSGREVELGAFLSPEERQDLHAVLTQTLARLRP